MDEISQSLKKEMGQVGIDILIEDLEKSGGMAVCYDCCDETEQVYVEAPEKYLRIVGD